MKIPKGANTCLAMQFLGSDIGRKWNEEKNYENLYSELGEFCATLDVYEIPQPDAIIKGIQYIIEEL